MNTLHDAARQALEALEYYQHRRLEWDYRDEAVITALRAALAEPVSTAVATRKPLTDEEIDKICASLGFAQLSPVEVARAIERAHGTE